MVRRVLVALVVLSATLAGSPGAEAGATATVPGVERIAGADRYATAEAVASRTHPGEADTVVVATGIGFADALAAGVAASALDAPLLLASPDDVPVEALHRYRPARVVVVGGTGAIPESVVGAIRFATAAPVDRLAGADRFETAAVVAESTSPDAEHTFTASGMSFGSALVAATHAARAGGRLVLSGSLPADVVEVDGATLHGTAAELNRALLGRFPAGGRTPIVTTIAAFPDALAATALAAAMDAPVLFVGATSAGAATMDVLAGLDAPSLVVVGGTAAVSGAILNQLLGWAPLPPALAPGADEAIAADVFSRVNAERAARGVPPLLWDAGLAAEAAAWAREMSVTGYRSSGALAPGLGENAHQLIPYCAAGDCSLPTSGALHRDWMHSAGHRDNVVEPGYALIGIGVLCGPDGTLWAVERFAVGFSPMSPGGSAPAPIVHDDTTGVTCEAQRVGPQPWWPVVDS